MRTALDGALDGAFELKVRGKGRRNRHVPMPAKLMEEEFGRTLQARKQPERWQCPKGGRSRFGPLRTLAAATSQRVRLCVFLAWPAMGCAG